MKETRGDVLSLVNQLPDTVKPGRESRLVGPAPAESDRIAREILAGGRESVDRLIEMIRDESGGDGKSYRPGHALRLAGMYVRDAGREKERRLLCDAIAAGLGVEGTGAGAKRFLIRELQLVGDAGVVGVVESLAPLLDSDELWEPAIDALVALGPAGAPALRAALGAARTDRRRGIVQALGVLRDTQSTASLLPLCEDADGETRLAAVSALATIGDAASTAAVLKAADAADGWERVQATKASVVLAERLAVSGDAEAARKIYSHLRDSRTLPSERHIRDLAERELRARGS